MAMAKRSRAGSWASRYSATISATSADRTTRSRAGLMVSARVSSSARAADTSSSSRSRARSISSSERAPRGSSPTLRRRGSRLWVMMPSGVLKACAVSSAVKRRASADARSASTRWSGGAGQFGNAVQRHEAAALGRAGAQGPGQPAEAAQAEPELDQQRQHAQGHGDINGGGGADRRSFPVGLAQRGPERLRRAVGGNHHPAPDPGANDGDRGQQFDRTVGIGVPEAGGPGLLAGRRQAVEHAQPHQLLALALQVLSRHRGRGRHVEEASGHRLRAEQQLDLGTERAQALNRPGQGGHCRTVGGFQSRPQGFGDQLALRLDAGDQQAVGFVVGGAELVVDQHRHRDEHGQDQNDLDRDRAPQPFARTPPDPSEVPMNPSPPVRASDSRTRNSFRSRRSCRRRRGICGGCA